jgi:hypothetical protein
MPAADREVERGVRHVPAGVVMRLIEECARLTRQKYLLAGSSRSSGMTLTFDRAAGVKPNSFR